MEILDFIPMGWEQSADFATIIGVIVNALFLGALIWQVFESRKAIKEAKRSADAARDAVQENVHARVDAQTHRVIALTGPLTMPPGRFSSDGSMHEWKDSPGFVLPKSAKDELWFGTRGKLINEGKGTARVSLHGWAKFIDDEEDMLLPGTVRNDGAKEWLLRPGEEVQFYWNDRHTVEDWVDAYNNPDPPNPHGHCGCEIVVTDSFEEGVIDHIWIEMAGRPLEPVPGDSARWGLAPEGSFITRSYPIHRTYRKEGWRGLTPPWGKTYEAWSEKHQQ